MKKFRFPVPDGKILIAVWVVFLCIEGLFVSYRHIYMETPEYSIRVIMAAARDGDADTVDAMVDEKALANEFFDIAAAKASSSSAPQIVLQLAWAPLRTDFATDIQALITGTITNDTDSASFQQAKKAVDTRLKSLGFPIPSTGWEYKNATWCHHTQAGYGEMTLTFYNTTLKTAIPVTVSLERAGARSWHIIGLTNTETLVTALQKAYDHQLAAYNKPIQEKLDQAVVIHSISSQLIRDDDTRQVFLRLHYTPMYNTGSSILTEVRGVYELRRTADKAVLYSSEMRLNLSSSGKSHTSQFLLNPLIPSQYAIMNRSDLRDTDSSLHITALTFEDGTELALADHLPEE
jgi:hypothetical protein